MRESIIKILGLFVGTLLFQSLFSQNPCLPGGIWITTQEQIDSFPINYPSCTEIEGTVLIEGEDITSLEGLNQIEKICGELKIFHANQLTNLTGLNNIKSLGHFQIALNQNLVNLSGLDSLLSIEGFSAIVANPNLVNIDALNNLTIIGSAVRISLNPSLTHISLNGLLSNGTNGTAGPYFEIAHNENLTAIDGLNSLIKAHDLQIAFNPSLKEISGLISLDTVHDGLIIAGNDSLTNISGINRLKAIIDGFPEIGLDIFLNQSLASIEGFDSLNRVEGDCRIEKNSSLMSLACFNKLQTITGALDINHNDFLNDFSGLESLLYVKEIDIINNDSLKDISGISNMYPDTLEYVRIAGNYTLNECAIESLCAYLTEYNGESWIANNGQGCNNADEIIEICETEGIEELISTSKVLIYPNPAGNGGITIKLTPFEKDTYLELYNDLGQKVYCDEITSQETQLEINFLNAGLYFVKIQNKGKLICETKFNVL